MKKLTWNDIETMTDDLAAQIRRAGFAPDYIVGITISGLIPLYFIARKLGNIRNILTVSAHSYEKDKQGDLVFTYLPEINLNGKNVLIIDEICATGNTLRQVSDIFIHKYKAGTVRSMTLITSNDSKFQPDFCAVKEHVDWVVFPWDKHEYPEHFA
jgi:uncharacterized protein